jgi:uncharacterized membrane protein YphA (DoxX/SURF4 family)
MRNPFYSRPPRIVGRLLLVGILLFAAGAKLRSLSQLESVLFVSGLVPYFALRVVAFMIIGAEVVVSALILLPRWSDLGSRMLIVVCCVFIAYSIWRGMNRIQVPCGCFGGLFKMSPLESIILDTVMIYIALCQIDERKPIREAARAS